MNNFIYDIPTKVYFGQGQIVHLPELIQTCGSRVLLGYGGGSVKKTGLYDTITHLLRENGIEWQELSGVQSNPKIGSVREGVRLVREHQLDCVLAAVRWIARKRSARAFRMPEIPGSWCSTARKCRTACR